MKMIDILGFFKSRGDGFKWTDEEDNLMPTVPAKNKDYRVRGSIGNNGDYIQDGTDENETLSQPEKETIFISVDPPPAAEIKSYLKFILDQAENSDIIIFRWSKYVHVIEKKKSGLFKRNKFIVRKATNDEFKKLVRIYPKNDQEAKFQHPQFLKSISEALNSLERHHR